MAAREQQKLREEALARGTGRKGKSVKERPFIFRDPSWSGEPDDDEEGEVESLGLRGGVTIMVDAGKGDGEGERGGLGVLERRGSRCVSFGRWRDRGCWSGDIRWRAWRLLGIFEFV